MDLSARTRDWRFVGRVGAGGPWSADRLRKCRRKVHFFLATSASVLGVEVDTSAAYQSLGSQFGRQDLRSAVLQEFLSRGRMSLQDFAKVI